MWITMMAAIAPATAAPRDPCATRSCSKCSLALGPPSCGTGTVSGCWEEGSAYLHQEYHTFGISYVYTFWYDFRGYRVIDDYAVRWYEDGGTVYGYTEHYEDQGFGGNTCILPPLNSRQLRNMRRSRVCQPGAVA